MANFVSYPHFLTYIALRQIPEVVFQCLCLQDRSRAPFECGASERRSPLWGSEQVWGVGYWGRWVLVLVEKAHWGQESRDSGSLNPTCDWRASSLPRVADKPGKSPALTARGRPVFWLSLDGRSSRTPITSLGLGFSWARKDKHSFYRVPEVSRGCEGLHSPGGVQGHS